METTPLGSNFKTALNTTLSGLYIQVFLIPQVFLRFAQVFLHSAQVFLRSVQVTCGYLKFNRGRG